MAVASTGATKLDFAVLGNEPMTLAWLQDVIASVESVRLVANGGGSAGHAERTGAVVLELDPVPASSAARLAVVLADPALIAAEHREVGYAHRLRGLLGQFGSRALVVSAEEVRSASGLTELLDHLGIEGAVTGTAPPALDPPAISASGRARLFATVRDDVEELESLTGRTFKSWRLAAPVAGAQPEPPDPAKLFYVGRRHDVPAAPGSTRLDEWEVLPVQLAPMLDQALHLTVLDPLSFPLDSLRRGDRDIPLAVALPQEWDADTMRALLGQPLLHHLTPLDTISIADDETWARLQLHYSWPRSLRVAADRLLLGRSEPATALAAQRARKAQFRALRDLVGPALSRAAEAIAPGERLSTLLVADEPRLWASLLPVGDSDLAGIGGNPAAASQAAFDYPDWRFTDEVPNGDGAVEAFHLGLSILALCTAEPSERARRLRSLLAGLRVGGRLIVIDRFIGAGGASNGARSPNALLGDIRDACAGHVVLEHVESLRLAGEDLTGIGMFVLSKIGRPVRR